MAEVHLANVTKIYPGGVKAVDDLTLRVSDREFIVLVGPSGCGKTTTLRLIAGLEFLTAGRVSISGGVVNDVRPKDRDVAMVLQSYALYPHMSVYNNMAFGLKLRGVIKREIDRKVRSAAGMLGIEGLLDRKPNALSSGQRQRVALGRAIVRAPKVFLFDEPLSNLDARLRVQMRAELKELHRSLSTTIYVTHDQEEAMTLGDRVAVMNKGVIQQCGSPLQVYSQPVNRFVAGFIGTPPMNFLEGRLLREGGHYYFTEGANKIRLPQRLEKFLVGRENRQIVLGIRPESLAVKDGSKFSDTEPSLNVKVDVIEPLGNRSDLYITTAAGNRLVCRVETNSLPRNGAELVMHLNMDQVHLFEPGDEGVNIILRDAGGWSSAG
ncbi:MAG: sn-glycerol-3-phosphate ABC transporter ATP-binding protein UgpC [Planctomycetota bacterium]|nr:MAG: sn-glycerol-3-phosphate ABC transporter ATP-binding protein UgpC [Planctomycetota bacterium]